jgi:hypothetical protein
MSASALPQQYTARASDSLMNTAIVSHGVHPRLDGAQSSATAPSPVTQTRTVEHDACVTAGGSAGHARR